MKYLPFFALSTILAGCFFDSSSAGAPTDGGPKAQEDGGSSAGGHGGKLPHLRGQDAGPDARVAQDGGNSGAGDDDGGSMLSDDGGPTVRLDAATPPADSSVPPEDSGAAGGAGDGSAPAAAGLTCAACSTMADCAPGYDCRAPGRCMIQAQHCEDIDTGLTNLLDGDGASRWCLPAYEIGVQHMSINAGCDAWLASH